MGIHLSGTENPIAPYIPTPFPIVKRMLELADLRRGETLMDLGCGDGRVAIAAARDFGAKSVGVDINNELVTYARVVSSRLGIDARFIRGDLLDVDVSQADVVTLYLGTEANEIVRPKLEAELRKGVRVVTHDYPISGWLSDHSEEAIEGSTRHALFLYTWRGKESENERWRQLSESDRSYNMSRGR
jgi:ubiquinone/menaquinone biosynthesis C-methylase UbiE